MPVIVSTRLRNPALLDEFWTDAVAAIKLRAITEDTSGPRSPA